MINIITLFLSPCLLFSIFLPSSFKWLSWKQHIAGSYSFPVYICDRWHLNGSILIMVSFTLSSGMFMALFYFLLLGTPLNLLFNQRTKAETCFTSTCVHLPSHPLTEVTTNLSVVDIILLLLKNFDHMYQWLNNMVSCFTHFKTSWKFYKADCFAQHRISNNQLNCCLWLELLFVVA